MKEKTNIKCTHCGYDWETKSKAKYATCPSCTRKTLNPLWIKANDIKLYRIWSYDQNDRSEIARAIAADFETVQNFSLNTFIKKEYRKDVDLTEFGLEWMDRTPEDCIKDNPEIEHIELKLKEPHAFGMIAETVEGQKQYAELEDELERLKETICEFCKGCTKGFQIEEIEKPSGQYFGETFEFKTIYGTNDFYDLTTKKYTKSKDWQPLLKRAFDISPQTHASMLTGLTKLAIAKDKTTDLEKSKAVKEITKFSKPFIKKRRKQK